MRTAAKGKPIEVEIDRLQDLDPLLKMRVDLVALQGFTPEQAAMAADHRQTINPGTLLEVRGDIALEDAAAYGNSGVDYGAVPALTDAVTPLRHQMKFV